MMYSLPWDRKMDTLQIYVILATVLHCDGVSIWKQLEHIASRKAESRGDLRRYADTRRFGLPGSETSVIIGAPSYPYHLPEAEPIVPGHTLIRPAMGMLKSAVKFPHRELENGAGVYGHIDNLGIRYDGKNERVLYTGFRRMLPESLQNYILVNLKEKVQKPIVPEIPVLKKRPGKDRNNYSKKMLTIYPAEIYRLAQGKKLNLQTKKHKKHRQKRTQNFTYLIKTLRDIGRDIFELHSQKYLKARNGNNDSDLRRFLRIMMSLRRDQNTKENETEEQNIARNNPGAIVVLTEPTEDSNYDSMKTKLFWETKNAFNHIKISPDAPDLTELLPADAADDTRDWWFYHQSDFEEFQER